MQSLVMSHLDYCNALLIGIQQDLIAMIAATTQQCCNDSIENQEV